MHGARRRASVQPSFAGLFFLEVGVLAVVTLLPLVHDVVRTGDVALLVVAEVADGGRPRAARLDRLRDLLRIERAGLLGGLCDDLRRSVGVERVGFRLESASAEL